MMPAARQPRWLDLLAFLAGLTTALAMVFFLFGTQSFVQDRFDPYFFGEMGKSLARGEGFAAYGTLLKRRSPMYPMFIGGIYYLFGEQPRLIQILQCLMLGATCWLVFDMGRRVFNVRTGLLAGFACALHPMMLRYVADLHLETLLTFLFTLTVWCSVRFHEQPTTGRGVALGFAGAAAALTKAVVVLYPAVFVFVWLVLRYLWAPERRRAAPRLIAIAVIPVTMLMLILPWTIRNYRATNGKFVLISSGFNDAMLRGYIFSKADYALLRRPPYTDGENETNQWFRALAREAGTEFERDDYETEQILGRVAKQKLREEPAEFLRKSVVGLFTFWYQMTSLKNSLLAGVLALGAWILAVIGVRRSLQDGRPIWLFLLPGIHLNLLLAVLLALGRYSVPILPSLLVASAYGIDVLLRRWLPRGQPIVASR
jgi:hypothetical protein